VPDQALRALPRVAPARATDLAGLPYTIVLTAGLDPLRDEGAEYADRLAQAGVRVDYRCYEGQLHAFLGNPAFKETAAARAELVSLLRAELG
jgi:acetyl esterase